MENVRKEKDSLGEINVSEKACWGAQTQRKVENFRVFEMKFPLQSNIMMPEKMI